MTITVSAREQVAPAYHLGVQSRFRFLARNRFQLAGALLWAVLIPALLRSNFAFLEGGNPQYTAIGSAAAVLLGAYVLRRMTVYPGTKRLLYVIPALSASFAAVIVVFFFA